MRLRSGTLLACVVVASALWAPAAAAQYQNRGIGAHVGFLALDPNQGLEWAIPVGLQASLYFDNHVEGTLHTTGMLTKQRVGSQLAFGFMMQIGARYLFLTDTFRPYVGAHVAYFQVFSPVTQYQYAGIGPSLGFDFFFSDAWSIGLRAQYTLFLQLRDPPTMQVPGVALEITTWY